MAYQYGRANISQPGQAATADQRNYVNTLSNQYKGASGRFSRTPEYKSLNLRDPRSAAQDIGQPYDPLTTAPPAIPGNQGVVNGSDKVIGPAPARSQERLNQLSGQAMGKQTISNITGMPKEAFVTGASLGAYAGKKYGLDPIATGLEVGMGLAMTPAIMGDMIANMITSGISERVLSKELNKLAETHGRDAVISATEKAIELNESGMTPDKYRNQLSGNLDLGNGAVPSSPISAFSTGTEESLNDMRSLEAIDDAQKRSTPTGLLKTGGGKLLDWMFNRDKKTQAGMYEKEVGSARGREMLSRNKPYDYSPFSDMYSKNLPEQLDASQPNSTLDEKLAAEFGSPGLPQGTPAIDNAPTSTSGEIPAGNTTDGSERENRPGETVTGGISGDPRNEGRPGEISYGTGGPGQFDPSADHKKSELESSGFIG